MAMLDMKLGHAEKSLKGTVSEECQGGQRGKGESDGGKEST